jgi:hypothetical protein
MIKLLLTKRFVQKRAQAGGSGKLEICFMQARFLGKYKPSTHVQTTSFGIKTKL